MAESSADTPITVEKLLAAGYGEFKPPEIDKADRMFGRRIYDGDDVRYAVNFRLWDNKRFGHGTSFDAQVWFNTDTAGVVWITIREDTIAATEARATALWQACGSKYYRRTSASPEPAELATASESIG